MRKRSGELLHFATAGRKGGGHEWHRGQRSEHEASLPPAESIHRRNRNGRIERVQRASRAERLSGWPCLLAILDQLDNEHHHEPDDEDH